MSAQPWFKFFPSDWRSDSALRMCGPVSRCLWLEMLCLMYEADPCGHLRVKGRPLSDQALAIQAGMSLEDVSASIAELEENGVFSRTSDGTIYSRKMVRDARKSAEQRKKAESRWTAENKEDLDPGIAKPHADGNADAYAQKPEARVQIEEPPFHGSPIVVDFPGLDPPVKIPAKRGSRLPTDWTPTPTDTAYAAERGFTESEIARHAEDFRDYWTARPGLGGTKLDWAATWRTRIRELADRRGAGLAGRPNTRGGGSGAVGLGEIIARRRGFLDD